MTPGNPDEQNAVPQNDFEVLAEEQRRLAEIGRIVSSTLNLDEIFAVFAEHAKQLVPFDRVIVAAMSDDGKQLVDKFIAGLELEGSRPPLGPLADDKIYQRVFIQQKPYVKNNSRPPAKLPTSVRTASALKAGLKSLLISPLLWRDEVIGMLAFRSTIPDAYDEHHVDLALQIAQQIAGAIATADQHATVESESQLRQKLADEQSRITEIGRIVSSTMDLDEALSAFVEQTRSLVPFDRIVINVANDDLTEVRNIFVDDSRPDAPFDMNLRPYPATDLTRHALLDQVVFVANGEDYKDYVNQVMPDRKDTIVGFNSILVIPLVWQRETIGGLILRSRLPDAYDTSVVELAKQIGAQITGAIASYNQRMIIEQEMDDREKLNEEQRSSAEIGRLISSTLDINEVFHSFAEQVRSLISFDRIVIASVSEDRTELIDQFVAGMQMEDSDPGKRILITKTNNEVYDRVFVGKKPFVATGQTLIDYAAREPSEKRRADAGLKSQLITPLIWKGEVEGVLTFRSLDPDAFGEHEVDLVLKISQQIADAIATADQYGLLERESRERRRLAEEQRSIAEIGRLISSTLDINEVFAVFAEQAQHLVPWDRLIVSAISDDRSLLIDKFIAGIEVVGPRAPLGALSRDKVYKRIFIEKKRFLELNQTQTHDLPPGIRRAEALKAGLKSMLVTPLLWKGEVAGVLTFRSTDPTAYDDHHADLALQISQQIAGHIATADQYAIVERESRERQRLADEQSRLAEIGRIVSSTLNVQDVLEAFVERARELVPIDRIVITATNLEQGTVSDCRTSAKMGHISALK